MESQNGQYESRKSGVGTELGGYDLLSTPLKVDISNRKINEFLDPVTRRKTDETVRRGCSNQDKDQLTPTHHL